MSESWLERDTGLILRWELLDMNRRPLAKLMFTELRVGDALDFERLEQELRDEKLVSRSLEAAVSARDSLTSEQGIRFRGLPPSFSLTGRAHANAVEQTGAEDVTYYFAPSMDYQLIKARYHGIILHGQIELDSYTSSCAPILAQAR